MYSFLDKFINNMADDQEQKREEMSELPDIPDVPPPPYPGPPDGTQYPPQHVPPYQGTTTYPPQQAPPGAAYPPQGVTYPQGAEYPPKEGAFYPPPGYQQGQYPPAYGQQQYPTGYPSGYQAVAQGGYPTQAYHGQGYAPPAGAMVVTSQPVAAAVVPMSTEPKPETYMVLSVITCLCCSPIFGLIAICFAGKCE